MARKKPRSTRAAHESGAHASTQELLHAYAHEILLGRSAEQAYPDIAKHLATCPACQLLLDELVIVARAVVQPERSAMLMHQQPDLSRLPKPAMLMPALAARTVQTIWLELTAELLRNWQPSALLGAARGSLLYDSADEHVEDLLDIRVRIFREENPALVSIVVLVDRHDAIAFDQAGSIVALHASELLQQQATDSAGIVRFSNIPSEVLSQLRVSITLDQAA
jgi:hypothetical protein